MPQQAKKSKTCSRLLLLSHLKIVKISNLKNTNWVISILTKLIFQIANYICMQLCIKKVKNDDIIKFMSLQKTLKRAYNFQSKNLSKNLQQVFLQQSNNQYGTKKILWKLIWKKYGRKCLQLRLPVPKLLTLSRNIQRRQ